MDRDPTTAAAAALPESFRRQQAAREAFELRRRAKALVIPTNDSAVRERLRALGEPITLFGEREAERRERLRDLLARAGSTDEGVPFDADAHDVEDGDGLAEVAAPAAELFYTEGPEALREWRLAIAKDSLGHAAARLRDAREGAKDAQARGDRLIGNARVVSEDCSEIGDDRPLSDCSISCDGSLLGTASWSGAFKVWHLDGCRKVMTVRAHQDRVTGFAFHPQTTAHAWAASEEGGNNTIHAATACSDGRARLWSSRGVCLATLEGHTARLGRCAFHPSGTALATASFDATWRLWDASTAQAVLLLEQEGHARACYEVAFQKDGALAVSCGLDALVRVWDCRTGKCVQNLRGHGSAVLCCDVSPDGHHVITGSEDATCKAWDLRAGGGRKSRGDALYTMPAHAGLVSRVRFDREVGALIASASFDGTVRLWSGRDHRLIARLEGHENKVTAADVQPTADAAHVVSVGFDRTIKIWACKGETQGGSPWGDVKMEEA